MKTLYTTRLFIGGLLLSLSVLLGSCSKSINEPSVSAYAPASTDDKAGAWKTYVLTAPTEVTLAAPAAVTSADYQAELATLKQKSTSLTGEQQDAVAYWGAGAVYRWNEIARELAARYNIPPASNADGKYPVPDAANPLADPKFPFANPPYTARALAYLSVAQYDALVAAWNYKFQFNRAAPYKADATIKAALPTSGLPSYPSEDAVVAAASFTVLKAMFPGEVPYLQAKFDEHKNSRLWAGMNVDSDLSAGSDLGTAVAAKIMARSKTDGMSGANNQTLTAGYIETAKGMGLTQPWVSQETPARPPMLPAYGLVTPWNFAKTTVPTLRPAAPPAIGSDGYKQAMNELLDIAKNQTRDQARIANYWSDGVGSYTPPGHWNRTVANTAHDASYSEVRMARTLALVNTAMMDAGICCWDAKFYYYYPRPQQVDSRIKTTVGVPNFPSYTSGHSMFSAAAAAVSSYIFPDKAAVFGAQAQEVSDSRVYGMIHYRFDCEAGLTVGRNIGTYAINRGKADGSGL